MVPVPPIILVFDANAIAITTPSEWREFARIGSCFIPQVVFEEVGQAFARSSDRDLAKVAKSFNHYLPISGWRLTDTATHHAVFKLKSEQAYSHRNRIALAVGRCAYGLSESFSQSLVILISKDRALLHRLYEIPSVNLCGITGEALLLWSRNGQRPIAVSQKLQQFRTAHGIKPPLADRSLSKAALLGTSSSTNFKSALRDRQSQSNSTTTEQRPIPIWLWLAAGVAIALCSWFFLKRLQPQPQPKLTSPNLQMFSEFQSL